jgi:hypothetical protein
MLKLLRPLQEYMNILYKENLGCVMENPPPWKCPHSFVGGGNTHCSLKVICKLLHYLYASGSKRFVLNLAIAKL